METMQQHSKLLILSVMFTMLLVLSSCFNAEKPAVVNLDVSFDNVTLPPLPAFPPLTTQPGSADNATTQPSDPEASNLWLLIVCIGSGVLYLVRRLYYGRKKSG